MTVKRQRRSPEFKSKVALAALKGDKTLAQLIAEFNQGYLQPTQSFAQQLFGEMTDRYYSLNALALATVDQAERLGVAGA